MNRVRGGFPSGPGGWRYRWFPRWSWGGVPGGFPGGSLSGYMGVSGWFPQGWVPWERGVNTNGVAPKVGVTQDKIGETQERFSQRENPGESDRRR